MVGKNLLLALKHYKPKTLTLTLGAVGVMVVGAVGVGKAGLGLSPVPSFGNHGPFSFVTCLGSWGFPGHWIRIQGAGTSAGLWLGWSHLGLLGPRFRTKLTL